MEADPGYHFSSFLELIPMDEVKNRRNYANEFYKVLIEKKRLEDYVNPEKLAIVREPNGRTRFKLQPMRGESFVEGTFKDPKHLVMFKEYWKNRKMPQSNRGKRNMSSSSEGSECDQRKRRKGIPFNEESECSSPSSSPPRSAQSPEGGINMHQIWFENEKTSRLEDDNKDLRHDNEMLRDDNQMLRYDNQTLRDENQMLRQMLRRENQVQSSEASAPPQYPRPENEPTLQSPPLNEYPPPENEPTLQSPPLNDGGSPASFSNGNEHSFSSSHDMWERIQSSELPAPPPSENEPISSFLPLNEDGLPSQPEAYLLEDFPLNEGELPSQPEAYPSEDVLDELFGGEKRFSHESPACKTSPQATSDEIPFGMMSTLDTPPLP